MGRGLSWTQAKTSDVEQDAGSLSMGRGLGVGWGPSQSPRRRSRRREGGAPGERRGLRGAGLEAASIPQTRSRKGAGASRARGAGPGALRRHE